MENVLKSKTHPLLLIAAIAVILFCVAGVAAIMGWIPKSGADSATPEVDAKSASAAAQPGTAQPRAQARTSSQGTSHAPLQVASAPPSARAVCRDCAVIEAVREIEREGEGTGVGAVAGGVLGGVVGHQVGAGRGRDLATVVGAVGGAVAGHQIEKNVKKTKVYQVTVRFEDGTTRVVSQSTAPSWRAGDHVRVVNGELRPI